MTQASLFRLVLAVAVTTFALRFVPMALLRQPLRSPRLVAFVELLPYSILAAMIVPGAFSAAGSPASSVGGLVAALALALAGRSLPVVAATAAAVAAAISLAGA